MHLMRESGVAREGAAQRGRDDHSALMRGARIKSADIGASRGLF